jgi:hypothetical protein
VSITKILIEVEAFSIANDYNYYLSNHNRPNNYYFPMMMKMMNPRMIPMKMSYLLLAEPAYAFLTTISCLKLHDIS